jgi:hypothetical protein
MPTTTTRPSRKRPGRRFRLWNAFTRWVLHTRLLRRLADRQVCELRLHGGHSGKPIALPVMYAEREDTIVVLVGAAETKLWWRNFTRPHPVEVYVRGALRAGIGHIADRDSPARAEAARIYGAKFDDLPVEDDPLLVIELEPDG